MARVQMIVFEIGENEFAIDAKLVNGIIRANKTHIQPVPTSSSHIDGMINWRDKVRYVFNVCKILRINNSSLVEDQKIIMVHSQELIIGCLVDEVTDILTFNSEEIETAPSFISNTDATCKCVSGVCKVDDRLIVILDVSTLLSLPGFEVGDTLNISSS